jgi:hypothetical protein
MQRQSITPANSLGGFVAEAMTLQRNVTCSAA